MSSGECIDFGPRRSRVATGVHTLNPGSPDRRLRTHPLPSGVVRGERNELTEFGYSDHGQGSKIPRGSDSPRAAISLTGNGRAASRGENGGSELRHDIQVGATSGVEPSTAIMVGEWYLRSRSAHRDARVVEAYRQLQVETDHLFVLLTRDACHRAIRVVFTRCAHPYESDQELIISARTNRTLEITSAAIAGERLHPLFDCAFGGAFDRFRAVHDLIGHAWCGYGFDLDDECAAWSAQDRLHGGLARFALATELYGVNAARGIIGEGPDLRALLLAPSTRSGICLSSTRRG